ncbi:hypothetical protein OAD53_02905 [Gammaproteobacteria bacterium]|nr:hypothetical protein [Gammaproteobacteria bacterium]
MKYQNKLIFSDTETTGRDERDFIQIIQSASLLTDEKFQTVGSMNVSCAPLPWTVPTPGAYLTHKKIDTLQSSDTHYQMMKSIHEQWKTWSQEEPAIFITYNGHAFDEELYRKQFFWNLLDPFVTNTNGNGRSDLLMLTRLVSQLFPDLIDFEINKNGNPVCRLESVVGRLGLDTSNAHDALSDCVFMVELLKFFKAAQPKLVDDYLLQATKQGCAEFLGQTKVIGYRHQPFARFWTYPIKFLGINPTNQNEAICVDLNYPIEDVIDLSYQDIMGYLAKPNAESPFKIIRLNKSQGMADANEFDFKFDCPLAELNANAERYDENPEWIERVLVASTDLEQKEWPKKAVIDQTIYEKFFGNGDRNLFQKFHNARSLEEKLSLCDRFNDPRAKAFGHRILFQESKTNLPAEIISSSKALIKERWTSEGPWPSVETYLSEAEELKHERTSPADQQIIVAVESYLKHNIQGVNYG